MYASLHSHSFMPDCIQAEKGRITLLDWPSSVACVPWTSIDWPCLVFKVHLPWLNYGTDCTRASKQQMCLFAALRDHLFSTHAGRNGFENNTSWVKRSFVGLNAAMLWRLSDWLSQLMSACLFPRLVVALICLDRKRGCVLSGRLRLNTTMSSSKSKLSQNTFWIIKMMIIKAQSLIVEASRLATMSTWLHSLTW